MFPIDVGIDPVKLLENKTSVDRGKSPSVAGRDPEKLFDDSRNEARDANLPMSAGKVPDIVLSSNEIEVSDVKANSSRGSVPES